jgi:hypothetical protein
VPNKKHSTKPPALGKGPVSGSGYGPVEITISTGGYSRTASGNAIFTGGFLKQPPVEMLFSLAVLLRKPPVEMLFPLAVCFI